MYLYSTTNRVPQHIVTAEGIRTDPTKLEAVSDLLKPENIKALRGFLALTGSYRRFMRNEEAKMVFRDLKKLCALLQYCHY